MGVDRRRSRGSKFETKKDTLERRTRKQMWKMTEVNSKKGRSRWRQTRKLLQQFGWDWWNLFLSYTRWNVDFSFPSGTVWKSHCTGGPWGTITRFWKLLDYLRQTKEFCHGATWWQTATVQLWGPLMINTMRLHLHKHFLTSQDFKLLLFCYWPHIFADFQTAMPLHL